MTIDAIVARSGIAKSTIYRHWESRDEVLIDVMHTCAPAIETPPAELGFERGLRRWAADLVRILNDPEWTRIIPALFMLKAHAAGIAVLERDLEQRQETAIEQVLQRGVDEGRLRADYDLEEACASIVGRCCSPTSPASHRSTTPSPIAPSTSSSTRTGPDSLPSTPS